MIPIFRILFVLICIVIIVRNIGNIVIPKSGPVFPPYYDEQMYKHLENLYNNSQYRLKTPTSIIADEIVFRYAAGAYLRGIDPILINSEITPLGKYFLSLSVYLFKNPEVTVVFFALFTLATLWLLGREVLHDNVLAFIPLTLFSLENVYLNQLRISPLLDIIQLPFILLSFVVFLREQKKGLFLMTAILLGFVIATKSLIPAILLSMCFALYLVITHPAVLVRFVFWLPVSGVILIASYVRTFMNGYNFLDFLKFQKWIFFYQKSKILYPFSVWKLLFFNQWQSWWGDNRILTTDDWSWTWPVSTLLGFIAMGIFAARKVSMKDPMALLILWFAILSVFLSLGVVSSRYFLPLFPVSFIVGVWTIRWGIQQLWR